MSSPRDPDMPRRRRFTLWSLLAPIALVVVIVAMYTAIHDSDVKQRDSSKAKTSSSKSTSSKTSTSTTPSCRPSRGHRVLAGETFQSIAKCFGLSEDQLKACNPELSDTYNLTVGTRLTVAKKFCTKAAKSGDSGSIDDL